MLWCYSEFSGLSFGSIWCIIVFLDLVVFSSLIFEINQVREMEFGL